MTTDLDALLPRITAHMPDFAAEATTLAAELRMITARAMTPPRR